MEPTLNGQFREVAGFGSYNSLIMVEHLGPKESDRYREVVDLWRWSVRDNLLYMHIHTTVV